MKSKDRLALWKERFAAAQAEYVPTVGRLDKLWQQYLGERTVDGDGFFKGKETTLLRNFTFELIESQVDNAVPLPKVRAPLCSEKKQRNARVIEQMLKDLISKLPLEKLNGEEERLTKALGASFRLLCWDAAAGGPVVRLLHPKQVVPQAGICELSLMDYVFVQSDDTRERLFRRYGVSVDGDGEQSDETVTQVSAYYINKNGRLGVFSWASDTVLEDEEEYTSRIISVCPECGRRLSQNAEKCVCGCEKPEKRVDEQETLTLETTLDDGTVLQKKVVAPYYTPKAFPVMIRKNVAVFGNFLGDSDCEQIRDLQQAHNKLASKLQQKMLKGGSVLTLPKGVRIETSDREDKIVYLDTPAQKAMIDAISLQPGITQDYEMLQKYYADARSTLGITDSYQGKPDSTAVSGTARQFAAQQTQGRLESKVRMKKTAYTELFRAMFEYMLAYSDEDKRFVGTDTETGEQTELVFSRKDFLEQDKNGNFYYDDDYIFEVDAAAPLVSDRQQLWAQTRADFLNGAFGNPSENASLLLYWKQLEASEYPGAGAVYNILLNRKEGI